MFQPQTDLAPVWAINAGEEEEKNKQKNPTKTPRADAQGTTSFPNTLHT